MGMMLFFGGLGILLARKAGAPQHLQLGLSLGLAILLVGILILDPGARPDLGEWAAGMGIAALVLVPVLGYAWGIRALRRRAQADGGTAAAPSAAFVRIEDDAALIRDLRARAGMQAGPDPERGVFSIAWRDAERRVTAAAQLAVAEGLAEIRCFWVDADSRGQGLGRGLLAQVEDAAREAGAARVALDLREGQGEGFWTRHGYSVDGTRQVPQGPDRISLSRDLA